VPETVTGAWPVGRSLPLTGHFRELVGHAPVPRRPTSGDVGCTGPSRWTTGETAGPASPPGATVAPWPGRCDSLSELDAARYISFTTFKQDGSPVATPVWITGAAGSYAFSTGGTSWKARRLLRNPSVQVQVCDMRGRVAPGAVTYVGTGEVVSTPDAVAAVERALAAKYGWQFRALALVDGLKSRFGRGGKDDSVAIHLSLDEA